MPGPGTNSPRGQLHFPTAASAGATHVRAGAVNPMSQDPVLRRLHEAFLHAVDGVKVGQSNLAPLMALDYGSWKRVEAVGDYAGYGLLHRWHHDVLPLEVIIAEYRTGFEAMVRAKDGAKDSPRLMLLGGGHGLEYAQGCAAWFMLLQQRGLTTLPALLQFPNWTTLYESSRCASCSPEGKEAAGDLVRNAMRDLIRIMEDWNQDGKQERFTSCFQHLCRDLDALATPANQAARQPCHMGHTCPGPSRFINDVGHSSADFHQRAHIAQLQPSREPGP